MVVYAQFGVHLDHNAQLQWNETARISDAELQPGDLVFFAATYPSKPSGSPTSGSTRAAAS